MSGSAWAAGSRRAFLSFADRLSGRRSSSTRGDGAFTQQPGGHTGNSRPISLRPRRRNGPSFVRRSIRHTVKAVIEGMPHIVTGGVPPVRAGVERRPSRALRVAGLPVLTLQSDDFAPDGPIPRACAAEGEDQAPVLRWSDVPAQTKSLVLMVEDPDASTPEPFVH